MDGVTKEQYGEDLEENLQDLSDRLKRMGYRPQPSRRSYIPKPGSEKGRPLGISCFEDKIVEPAVKRVLKPKEFTFLGFTRYCGKTRNGKFKVKRRTSRKALARSLREFTEWARKSRAVLRKGEMLRSANIGR